MRFITATFIFAILWFFVVVLVGRYLLPPFDPNVYPKVYLGGIILYASVLTINRLQHKG